MRSIRVLAFACLATCLVGRGEGLPRTTVPPTDHPPRIDGVLDDACWQNAPKNGKFVQPQSAKAALQATEFRLVGSNDALYVAIRCHEPDIAGLRARCTEHDGPLWSDDCVEVFLSPNNKGMEYIQIIVNSLGTTWDARVTQMGVSTDPSFETGVTAAARLEKAAWTVEIKIPFAGLNLAADTGTTWGLNVAREKKTKPAELSCWAPTGIEKFGVPAKFGHLKLLNTSYSLFAWTIGEFALADPRFVAEHTTETILACRLRSLGTSPGAIAFVATVEQEDGATVTGTQNLTLAAGATAGIRVPLVLSAPIRSIRYRVLAADTRQPLTLGSRVVRLSCAPIELRLVTPWYRDAIYASCPIEAVEAQVVVHGDSPRSLVAVLRGKTGPGQRLALTVRPGHPGVVRFPAANLAVGDWTLSLEDDTTGKVRVKRTIRVYPPHEGEVCLDREGRLLCDGTPFFAWGFMGAGPDERLARAGFNTVHTYIGYYIHRDKDLPAWLDHCRKLGLKAVMYCYPGEVGIHINKKKTRFTDRELERIATFVRLYRNHPALLGWYLCDEPRGRIFRDDMKRVHDVVAEADPFHPCIVLDNNGRGVAELADAGEILWVDPYPGFAKGGPPRLPLSMVGVAVDDMIRATGSRNRSFWVAPQAFNWGVWGGPKKETERAPTYTEERSMTYLSLVHGARGIVYFAWGYALKEPELAAGLLDRLGPELRGLMPYWLHGEDIPGVRVICRPSDSMIQVRVFRWKGRLLIVAVNPHPTAVTARLAIPGLPSGRLEVISEKRSIQTRQDGIEDHFSPSETHLYQTPMP